MRVLFLFCISLLLSFRAFGGPHIEPYGGYVFMGETVESGLSNDLNYSYDETGLTYGIKAGWAFASFFTFGFDISRSQLEWEMTGPQAAITSINDAGNQAKEEWEGYYSGVYGGLELPLSLRLWGTYYFSVTLQDQTNSSIFAKNLELSGTGYGVGVGYRIFEYLSLNFEYRKFEFDEVSIPSTGAEINLPSSANSIGIHKSEQFLFGVSFPFTLF